VRSSLAILRLVAATDEGALRLFDVNLRPPLLAPEVIAGSLELANALKLNDQELPVLADVFGLRGGVQDQVAALARRFRLALVALTRGAAGSLLFADGCWSDHPGLLVAVCDTVGGGDAFTAALTVGWLSGWPLDEINRRANEVAAFVCGQPGATPALPESLRRRFFAQGEAPPQIAGRPLRHARRYQSSVFTNPTTLIPTVAGCEGRVLS
jgi:fructokinase